MTRYHSPLYPFDEEISSLDASIREAELFDDTMQLERVMEDDERGIW